MVQCYSKLVTKIYHFCEFYAATLNQAHFYSVAQRFLHFFQLIFLRQQGEAPLRGEVSEGLLYQRRNKLVILGGNYPVWCVCPKKDGAS